jgi:flavodoxin
MMKTLSKILICIICISAILGCTNKKGTVTPSVEKVESKKILIVCLTRTKNTKAIAEIIHQSVGGQLVELETQTPYPTDYRTMVDQVQKENETGFHPPLKTKIDSINSYDVIFIGFPTWGMQLPPPMKSFLQQYDLSGKTVVPFNTNAGYGLGSSIETVKKMAPKSNILQEFSTTGGIERDGILFVMVNEKKYKAEQEVNDWLKRIGLTK